MVIWEAAARSEIREAVFFSFDATHLTGMGLQKKVQIQKIKIESEHFLHQADMFLNHAFLRNPNEP